MSTSPSEKSNIKLITSKIHTQESILSVLSVLRFKEKKIVFTNGCFDIIHRGHIDYLSKAADLGNFLVIGINSDSSVKSLNKGTTRPLQDEHSRAIILASLSFVNAVLIFEESTPATLIELIKPDILVKGADYDAEETDAKSKKYIIGSHFVKANGGSVKTIEFLEGYSTTTIENKIKSSIK